MSYIKFSESQTSKEKSTVESKSTPKKILSATRPLSSIVGRTQHKRVSSDSNNSSIISTTNKKLRRSNSFNKESYKQNILEELGNFVVKSKQIYVCGDKHTGKTTLIDALNSVNCQNINNNTGPKKPRKRKKRSVEKPLHIPREKLIKSTSLTKNVTPLQFNEIKDINNEFIELKNSYSPFIIVFSVIDESSFLFLDKTIKEIKNKIEADPFIIIVGNKLDLLADKTTKMDELLLRGFKVSVKYNCKYLCISALVAKNSYNVHNKLSISYQRRTAITILYLLNTETSIIEKRNNLNIIENDTIFFDDYNDIHIEGEIALISNINTYISYYSILKGQFMFLLCKENPIQKFILYIPVCNIGKLKTLNNSKILTITRPDGTTFSFKSLSRKKDISMWEQPLNNCISQVDDINETYSLQIFSKIREKCLKTSQTLSFSSLYNLCSKSKCVDCGRFGCFYISFGFSVLLCETCSSCHNFLLSSDISQIKDIVEAVKYPRYWKHLGHQTNIIFNLLWESKLNIDDKIKERSSLEQRKQFISKKYQNKDFYNSHKDLIQVKIHKGIDHIWEPRLISMTSCGEIMISNSDNTNIIHSFHASWCYIEKYTNDEIKANYFQIIGPKSSAIYRAPSSNIARKWIFLINNAKIRKYRPKMVNETKYNNIIYRPMPEINIDQSSIQLDHIQDLIKEKEHLFELRKIKTKKQKKRMQLLEQLREIEFEIKSVNKAEEITISQINILEPKVIIHDLSELRAIISIGPSKFKTDNQFPQSARRTEPKLSLQPKLSYVDVVTPRLRNFSYDSDSITPIIQNTMKAIEEGTSEFESTSGYITSATISRLFSALTDPRYNEPNYLDIFLCTFPYILSSIDFFKELCIRFGIANFEKKIETKMERDSTSKNIKIQVKSVVDNLSLDSLIKNNNNNNTNDNALKSRTMLLNILAHWMSGYWNSDFSTNPYLIVFILSFLDYVVQPIPTLRTKANTLRNYIKEKFYIRTKEIFNENTKSLFDTFGNVNKQVEHIEFQNMGQYILDNDAFEIAKAICFISQSIYDNIEPREFLYKGWTTDTKSILSKHITMLTTLFNQITGWISSCFVFQNKNRQRVKLLDKFIHIAHHCKEFSNFHALVAIIGALKDPGVSRCHKTWKSIPVKLQSSFEDLVNIISVEGNWKEYRSLLKTAYIEKIPCVPYIGVFLKDLVMIEDGISEYINKDKKIINFTKHRKIARIILKAMSFQNNPYNFTHSPIITETIYHLLHETLFLTEQERYKQSLIIEPRK